MTVHDDLEASSRPATTVQYFKISRLESGLGMLLCCKRPWKLDEPKATDRPDEMFSELVHQVP